MGGTMPVAYERTGGALHNGETPADKRRPEGEPPYGAGRRPLRAALRVHVHKGKRIPTPVRALARNDTTF